MRQILWECPVDGCDWTYQMKDLPPPVPLVFPYPLAAAAVCGQAMNAAAAEEQRKMVSAAIGASAQKHSALVEGALREHLESHDVQDFVRTIDQLKCDLYQQHSGIRPHTYRPAAPDGAHVPPERRWM